MPPCRSERARDELKGTAFPLVPRVIVDLHRERARSYRGGAAWYETKERSSSNQTILKE